MLKLATYYRSSASYRVRIALNLKQLDWSAVPINLLKSEQREHSYLDKNPQGLVPALALQGSWLNQSLAIIEYLDQAHPDPELLPRDRLERAQVRALAYQIVMDIHPLNNLRVLSQLKEQFTADADAIKQWYQKWVAEGFAAFETVLQTQNSNGRFCFGHAVSLADICLIPQLYNARRFACDLSQYPLICSIGEYCECVPAFRDAHPEKQQDAI